MAETTDTGLLPRTYFRAPRVPFDFRGLAIAIAGYLVYWSGGLLWREVFKVDVSGAFHRAAYRIFADVPYVGFEIGRLMGRLFGTDVFGPAAAYTFWEVLAGGAWFFLVWSFVALAVQRIAALRIARDEGLSLGEAVKFSIKNWPTMLLVPLFIAGAIAFFYLCNMLAGVVIAVPVLGGILSVILVPLAVISSLLILLIGVGGIFGLPVVGAAAAWERNGSLDAISRAFSYLFARPLQFFWNYFLIFLFLGIVLLVGNWFIFTLVKSVDAGNWNDTSSILVDAPPRSNVEGADFAGLSNEDKDLYNRLEEKTGYKASEAAPHAEPFARHFETVIQAPWTHKLTALVFWVFLNLIWFGIFGYALYWFLGASTSVYADLRADVDGTEEDEIYLEEEEEDFESLAKGGPTVPAPEPGAPAPATAPGATATSPPAPESGTGTPTP
jgi:hypothetical protein